MFPGASFLKPFVGLPAIFSHPWSDDDSLSGESLFFRLFPPLHYLSPGVSVFSLSSDEMLRAVGDDFLLSGAVI